MKLHLFILCLCSIVMSAGADSDNPAERKSELPNILFILADDVGYGDLGVYGGREPTPNIDRLARQGMRFTDAHSTAALCAPSRYSIITGGYPYRNGRSGGSWDVNNSSAFSFNGDKTRAGRHLTVGDILQKAGYETAFFGKMHFGGNVYNAKGELIRDKDKLNTMDFSRGVGDTINQHGFNYSLGLQSGIQHEPHAFFENGKFMPINPQFPADNSSTRLLTNGFYRVSDNGLSEIVEASEIPARTDVDYDSSQVGIILNNKAIQFIERHLAENNKRGLRRPFLLYYASQAIHVPHTPPFDFDGDATTIDEQVWSVTGAVTSDMLYELDLQVGKLLAKLEDEGIADNTLIFFTSDNGALWPSVTKYADPKHDNNGPLRGYKASVYEGGHRVPFIAKWGDGTAHGSKIKPDSVSGQLIVNHDWVAAMYELTRQDMEIDQAMDSASLLPILLGQQPESEPLHDFVIYQAGYSEVGAIREGDLVLVIDEYKKAVELYDLANDLAQEHNLIDIKKYRGAVNRLRKKFLKYHDRDNTTFDEPRTTKPYRRSR